MSEESWHLTGGPFYPAPRSPVGAFVKRWSVRLLVLAAVTGVVVAFHRPALLAFSRAFRVNDPAESDVIVLLLGGASHRPALAADLFKRKIAPRILFCQIERGPDDQSSESDRSAEMLREFGVPASAITVLPGNVTSTRDEALRIKREWEAAGKAWKGVTIVTTSFHTARARWIFRRTFDDPGVTFHMAAADHPKFNDDNWYKNEDGLIHYLNELIKTVFYRLRY